MDFLVNRTDLHVFKVVDRAPVGLERGGAVRDRVVRTRLEQHHLWGLRRGDALLEVLPRRGRLGSDPRLGLRQRRRDRQRRAPGGDPGLRLSAPVEPRGDPARPLRPARLRGRVAAPGEPPPPPIRGYRAVDSDPVYDPEREDEQILFWPLFFTSWLIDDFLADEDFFGAETIVIGSASSKTALSAAFLLAQREGSK